MNYWPMRVFQAGLWALAAFLLLTYGYERYISGLGWWALFFLVLALCAGWDSYRAVRGYVYWYGNPNNAKMSSNPEVELDKPFMVCLDTGLDNLTMHFEVELTNDEEKVK